MAETRPTNAKVVYTRFGEVSDRGINPPALADRMATARTMSVRFTVWTEEFDCDGEEDGLAGALESLDVRRLERDMVALVERAIGHHHGGVRRCVDIEHELLFDGDR